MFDIIIIGLGATGVSLLNHLQDEVYTSQLKRSEIAVFNPSYLSVKITNIFVNENFFWHSMDLFGLHGVILYLMKYFQN